MGQSTFMTVIMLASLLLLCSSKRSFECVDTEDCTTTQCCMLGAVRYSIPRCVDLGDVGSVCRPSAEAYNTTVSYPDIEGGVSLTNVYWLFCNCRDGLFCDRETHACQLQRD